MPEVRGFEIVSSGVALRAVLRAPPTDEVLAVGGVVLDVVIQLDAASGAEVHLENSSETERSSCRLSPGRQVIRSRT